MSVGRTMPAPHESPGCVVDAVVTVVVRAVVVSNVEVVVEVVEVVGVVVSSRLAITFPTLRAEPTNHSVAISRCKRTK